MYPEIVHSIILILTITASFLFSKTSLVTYDIQIFALLFILLFIGRRISLNGPFSRLLESIVFTAIIIITINTTGQTESPFFFLIYFLLFSLSLLLEPVISITTTIALVVCFLLTLPEGQNLTRLLPIFSLAFLTPFALFMGQEYIKSQKAKVKIQKLRTTLSNKEEDTFLFLSLMLKNHLNTIKEAVENFMGDHQLVTIRKQVKNMERLIDEFEKKS
ncbi:hypothetical protein COT62_03225 [Candidatus Roizmanbacteria bacterium CG09_land_8_20_14_0_10_41_9]|uniref:Uncharacterized protein n=1 Tax=Candidatus Roizmanbacteria bacterium CG09_land_8_20_14_0_10_41_9 TaxID=1974850 RepID=A0A2H0WSC5_9BACT|nr:MAG: hypothetical protein COT62_03225 [Candidatus Roizmanbacteria bacterium CG09_land_8_20_14_0_10_41_9]